MQIQYSNSDMQIHKHKMKWTNLFIKFLEITKRSRGLMITNLSDLLQKICTTANPLEVAFVTFWLTPSLPLTSGCPLTIKMQKKKHFSKTQA